MKIKKETIVWIFLIVPFFYPSSIVDTSLSSIWYYWKLCAVACGVIYIFKRIKKNKMFGKINVVYNCNVHNADNSFCYKQT